jgi:hypothetical protein
MDVPSGIITITFFTGFTSWAKSIAEAMNKQKIILNFLIG